MRAVLTTCAAVLAVLAVVMGIIHFATRAREYQVAIAADDTIDQRVFGTAAEMLRKQHAPVRIEVVVADKPKAALEMLEADKVKLAVVRSDLAMQGRAQTVLIMRREWAVLIAPKGSKVKKITDLANATVGVTRDGPLDGGLMPSVLDYYGIPRDKAKFVPVAAEDVGSVIRQKKVDAILLIGALASKQVGDIVSEAAKAAKGAIKFIDIEEADAIAKRIPALDSIEVDAGLFGGRPPRPADSFNTIGFTVRLVGSEKTTTDDMAELVRQLYLIRQNLNAAITGAGLMVAPDVEEATPFLIHPGVRAYVNGDQHNLLDRYSDWIYLGAFALSGLGSVAAAFFGWLSGGRLVAHVPAERVGALLDAVRDAKTGADLDQVEREADTIFRVVLRDGAAGRLQPAEIASFGIVLDELRSRIAARRLALAGGISPPLRRTV